MFVAQSRLLITNKLFLGSSNLFSW